MSNQKLSQADLKFLANFAGLKYRANYEGMPVKVYVAPEGNQFDCKKWNPLLPEHGWLILKALVEANKREVQCVYDRHEDDSLDWSWMRVLWDLSEVARENAQIDDEDFDFWPAVSAAALATGKDGG